MHAPFIHTKKGSGLLEVVVGSAIILTGILALTNSYLTYVKFALRTDKDVQAAYILEEGLEAVTFLRDKGWTAYITPLTASTTYYLAFNGSYWAATTTPQYVDGVFLRSIVFSEVARDADDRIAASGTPDPDTRFVRATVTYSQAHGTTTKSIATYITNIHDN